MSNCNPQTPIYRPSFALTQSILFNIVIALSVVLSIHAIICIFFILFPHKKKDKVHDSMQIQQNENRMQKIRPNLPDFQKQLELNYENYNQKQTHSGLERGQFQPPEHQRQNANNQNPKNQNLPNQQLITDQLTIPEKISQKLLQILAPSKGKTVVICIIMIVLMILTFIMLLLSVLSTWQAVSYNYQNAECNLRETNSLLVNGDTNWVGLNNIQKNISRLNVSLFSKVSVSKNAIRGLLLSGTIAVIKPGLGFPNNTQIRNITNELNGTGSQNPVINTTSVKSYIDLGLRQWLFRNTSLSSTIKFPICQKSIVPITHPIDSNKTLSLNYMDSICKKLTEQVDSFVQNGQAVDDLLVALVNVENKMKIMGENITSYYSNYENVSMEGAEYSTAFSTMGQDTSPVKIFTLVTFILFCVYAIITILYFIFICLSRQTVKTPCMARFLLMMSILIGLVITFCSIYLANGSKYSSERCSHFGKLLTDKSVFAQSPSLNAIPLANSLQSCTAGLMPYFKVTPSAFANLQRQTIDQLRNLSLIYNKTQPPPLLQSFSNLQIQLLKDYLFNLDQIPIKSIGDTAQFSNLTINQSIAQLQSYSDGSNPSSQQALKCPSIITQDHYVYNAYNCQHQLINMSNTSQWVTRSPRCIQIPSYNGSSGTNTTLLNQAQHNIQLTATCNSVTKFFNLSSIGCFMNVRKNLFNVSSDCMAVGTQYGNRVVNLVKFSVDVAVYTDLYLQNLRNYFGTYITLSSNLTQFFRGKNMTKIMGEFGTLSNNLLDKTSCSYIQNKANIVYQNYCPNSNSISVLLNQASVWGLVSLTFFPFLAISIFAIDLSLRNITIEEQVQIPKQSSKKMIELSEQTLNNEEDNANNLEVSNNLEHNIVNSEIENINRKNIFKQLSVDSKSQMSSGLSKHETVEIERQKNKQIQFSTIKKNQQRIIFKKQINDLSNSADIIQDGNISDYVYIQRKLPPIFFGFSDSEDQNSLKIQSQFEAKHQKGNANQQSQKQYNSQPLKQQIQTEDKIKRKIRKIKTNNSGLHSNMQIINHQEPDDGKIQTIQL